MLEVVNAYRTEDGKLFTDKDEAARYAFRTAVQKLARAELNLEEDPTGLSVDFLVDQMSKLDAILANCRKERRGTSGPTPISSEVVDDQKAA